MSGLVRSQNKVSVSVSISRDPKSKSRSRSRSHETKNESLGLGLVFETVKMIGLVHHCFQDILPIIDCMKLNRVYFFLSYLWISVSVVLKLCLYKTYHFIFFYFVGVPYKILVNFFSGSPVLLHTNIYLFVLTKIYGAFH